MTWTLLDHAATYASVLVSIEDAGGEVDDAAIAALDAIEDEFTNKVECIADLIDEYEYRADVARREEAKQVKRKARFENNAKRLTAYLKTCLEVAGQSRVETADRTISIAQNGQPAIRWIYDGPIPEEYRLVAEPVVSLNRTKAIEDWKANRLPDGFEVIKGTHLRIRS